MFTEAGYEQAVIEVFRDRFGYTLIYGPDVERDYGDPLYEIELLHVASRINEALPEAAIREALEKTWNIADGGLVSRNKIFMNYLQNGIPVNYFYDGEDKSALVYLVDYKDPESNTFTVVNQWTVAGASEAYRQLRNYMHEIPVLFVHNVFCVMSDLAHSKAGTITADEDRFMEWKTVDGQLFDQFTACADFLRQIPEQVESRVHLKQLLDGRQANGIIFTTMQKFEESAEPLSQRRNIVVIADEAHRVNKHFTPAMYPLSVD